DDVSEKLGSDETVKYNPSKTQLINATKITGRDKNGWGVGIMNAITLPAVAQVENTKTGRLREVIAQPFTNYNVAVVEKTINNNSYVSLINSNLSMVDNPYSANVTATQFQLKNKKQNYQLMGIAGLSHKSMAETKNGYGYMLNFSKINGKVRYLAQRTVYSNSLDINDMGYLQRNNVSENRAQLSYQVNDPFSIFKSIYTHVEIENERLFQPSSHIGNEIGLWGSATFKNNWWTGIYYGYQFAENDFFEPRSSNHRFYVVPAHQVCEVNFNSDSNKKISLNSNIGAYFMQDPGRWGNWSFFNIWWKVTPGLNISYNFSFDNEHNAKGFVESFNNDSIFFSNYQRETFVNTISVNYYINTRLGIDFRARHYHSTADYDQMLLLLDRDGYLQSYYENSNNPDVNFNAFNIDMGIKWEFAPGSELSIAWKNAISTENDQVNLKHGKNLLNTLKAKQVNTLSVKLLYYLDVNRFIKKV
ncbi:MAG TPA: DUF5916 domain-containing protein, partial [Prolixibacteraceae bacterium]|nr:DUF5916 domain-containing protein [Prolixibacteraceae bacterium]